jgi:hypothetical protein
MIAAGAMRVELDIFSGRPNPSWEIGGADEAELRSLVQDLPSSGAGGSPQLPGLGYRGFVLKLPDPVRIFDGRLFHHAGGGPPARAQATDTVERWLLERGRPHLEESVYRAALDAIGARFNASRR